MPTVIKGPTLNLDCSLWRWPNVVGNPPDVVMKANLSHGKRIDTNMALAELFFSAVVTGQGLMCPAGANIAGFGEVIGGPAFTDVVEVPSGSGCFYVVATVADVGKGFPNEYRYATLMKNNLYVTALTGNPWGAPGWPVPAP